VIYDVIIDKKVLKDLRQIDKKEQKKIIETIETKLCHDPYSGKKLAGALSDFYRYRVGNYRIIYLVKDQEILIEIIRVRHRKEVYR
jgi:mRNA interferase RelE/StbE